MKRLLFYSSVCLLMILFYGCTHQGDGKLPKVTTGNIALLYPPRHYGNSYLVSGYIEANGAVVLTYGICYSMSDKKPDINGHHIDATNFVSACLNESSPIRQGEQKQSIVVPFDRDLEYDVSMWENWDVIYVRAYATTADGTVVYGKTKTYHPEDCTPPESWDLVTRPNGWKLVSITRDGSSLDIFSWGEYYIRPGDIVFFNKDGSLQHFDGDGNNVTYSDEWWSYRLETSLEDFIRNGTSESFYPEYGTGFMLGCAYSYFSTLEISTNEMRISGQCGGENYELVFVPAP